MTVANLTVVTSAVSGTGKTHYILRQATALGATYHPVAVRPATSLQAVLVALQAIRKRSEDESPRLIHVDVSNPLPAELEAIVEALHGRKPDANGRPILLPTDYVFVEMPSTMILSSLGGSLGSLLKNHVVCVETRADRLDLQVPVLRPLEGEGSGLEVTWEQSRSLDIAGKVLKALYEGRFDPENPNFNYNWSLNTCVTISPLELYELLLKEVMTCKRSSSRQAAPTFRTLSNFAKLRSLLLRQLEGWNLMNLRLLSEFDRGLAGLKDSVTALMASSAHFFSQVPVAPEQLIKRHWRLPLCKNLEQRLPKVLLPTNLMGTLVDSFLFGRVGTTLWEKYPYPMPLLKMDVTMGTDVVGFCIWLPPLGKMKDFFTERTLQSLATCDVKGLDLEAVQPAELLEHFRRNVGVLQWPREILEGNNSFGTHEFLTAVAVHWRLYEGVPTLLIEQDITGQGSSFLAKIFASSMRCRRPDVEIDLSLMSSEQEVWDSLQGLHPTSPTRGRVDTGPTLLMLCLRSAPSHRAVLNRTMLSVLKSLLLDGICMGRRIREDLLLLGSIQGLEYNDAVGALPQSLLDATWPVQ